MTGVNLRMKGIVVHKFGGPDVLEYTEIPVPTPREDQVLIQVEGASVNYADIKARSGEYHLGKKTPYVPGLDLSGTIVEVGKNVKTFKIGDRVSAFSSSGSYAELATADEQLTFSLPADLDNKTTAGFPLVAGAAMHMLTQGAGLQENESVLIHAASGGVGSMAVQIAKARGASCIVATTGNMWKKEFLKGLGATAVIDLTDSNYLNHLRKVVPGNKVDVILNPLGGDLILRDLEILNDFGRLIVYGKMLLDKVKIVPETLYPANLSIIGFSFGHYRKYRPSLIRPTIDAVIELLSSRKLRVPEAASYPLIEAAKAHDFVERQKATGKVFLVP